MSARVAALASLIIPVSMPRQTTDEKENLVRTSRITIRFAAHEMAVIETVASEEGVTTAEMIRRLIFWKRNPDFSKHFSELINWLT